MTQSRRRAQLLLLVALVALGVWSEAVIAGPPAGAPANNANNAAAGANNKNNAGAGANNKNTGTAAGAVDLLPPTMPSMTDILSGCTLKKTCESPDAAATTAAGGKTGAGTPGQPAPGGKTGAGAATTTTGAGGKPVATPKGSPVPGGKPGATTAKVPAGTVKPPKL